MAGSFTLIIAEKPSVGRDIAAVVGAHRKRDGYLEGDGIRVSWCIGHLAELCEPHEYDAKWKSWSPALLPILPARFRARPTRSGGKQFRVVNTLLRSPDVSTVVNACDAGREGELIFRLVYELAGCTKPVRRLWISSLTQQAIRAGMERLRPGAALDALADAARCRAEADWLVGMNATRAMTGLARSAGGAALMSVGRVQTPTLALIVRREQAIEVFVSEPFWQVKARFAASPAGHYEGLWHRWPESTPPRASGPSKGASATDPGDDPADKDAGTRLSSRAQAEAIADAVRDQPGRIAKVTHKTVTERPPLLFDLTTLQKTANRRYGMSAERTLAAAQALYETHKVITYPRTDSRYLTSDMSGQLGDVLTGLAALPYGDLARTAHARLIAHGPPGRRMIDDSEVGDHHAIIPTGTSAKLERMGADERRVLELIVRRFVAGFFGDARSARTRIDTVVSQHLFVSEGTVCLDPGWQEAEPPPPRRDSAPALPEVRKDAPVHTAAVAIHEGATQPPRRYTEASLLGAMERADRTISADELRRALRDKGLGTPATRAAVIENLLKRQYIERSGQSLHPTVHGRALIAAIPVDDLLSAEMTGAWEEKLARIARGELDRAWFMEEIRAFTERMVTTIRSADSTAVAGVAAEPLGSCPVCGTPVTEGFHAYQCAHKKACSFVVHKRIAGRKTSPSLVQVLLSRGRSQVLKGFRSRSGKRFSAALVLSKEGTIELEFPGSGSSAASHGGAGAGKAPRARSRAGRAASPAARRADKPQAQPRCPKCRQGHIIAGNRGWGCSRWRQGCRFVVWFEQSGFRVPDDEAERLFRRGQTRLMDGLATGGTARLVLDIEHDGNVRIEPGKRRRRADS